MKYEVETDGSIEKLPDTWKKRGICRRGNVLYFSESTINLINYFPIKRKACRVSCDIISDQDFSVRLDQTDSNLEVALEIFHSFLQLSMKAAFVWQGMVMAYDPQKGISFEVHHYDQSIAEIRAERLRQFLMILWEKAFFQMEIMEK